MAEALPKRRCRSSLAVPGSHPRMAGHAAASDVDHVFLDLEDACAPSEKTASRDRVVESITELDWGEKIVAVRINDAASPRCYADVIGVVPRTIARLDSIILPKVENAAQVHFIDQLLTQLEAEHGAERRIGLELLIETPAGASNMKAIAEAVPRAEAMILGVGDYASNLGIVQFRMGMIDPDYPGHQWHWVMSEMSVHAKAAGLRVIDGPYVDFNDEPGFRETCMRSRRLGFDGKWVLHPNQIPWANEEFSTVGDDLEFANRVLEEYSAALADGRGAIAIDGMVVDEATRKMAERVARRHPAAAAED